MAPFGGNIWLCLRAHASGAAQSNRKNGQRWKGAIFVATEKPIKPAQPGVVSDN